MVTEMTDGESLITARKMTMSIGKTTSWAAALALCAIATSASGAAQAAESQVEISYEVKVSGVTAMRISYKAALGENSYQSTASIKTKGLADLFSGYRMEMAAAGAFGSDWLKPSHYRSEASGSKKKVLEVSWQDDNPAVRSVPKDKEDDAMVADGLSSGLVDPLSMLLRKSALQSGQPCPGTERVVDGREVFDLRFASAGEVTIGSSSPGVYRGKALKCSMTYTPVAGRPAVKFKKAGSVPSKFDVWFAPIGATADGKALFVPVLATGKLQGLSFVAYAREANVDGRKLAED